MILSYFQAQDLIKARREQQATVTVSPDLGLTVVEVQLEDEGVRFPVDRWVAWEDLETIQSYETGCFYWEKGELQRIKAFSETTNRALSLMPTEGAPTLLVGGFPMHRIKDIDPHQDTLLKIETIAPLVGRVLDTATGLGYTAIEAAKTAELVVTIELDPFVLEIARLNPWSRGLLDNPRIEQRIGDAFELIRAFQSESFDRILHDPPTFSLAGELYSESFYHELFRVLAPGGRMFHYIGDLKSRSGRRVARGAIQRLKGVGFKRIQRRNEAFGLVAKK
jgi:hypothetical protein